MRVSSLMNFRISFVISVHKVESRAYLESMSGTTAKSKPTASKIDEKELARLQQQDYWLKITRAKLVMDLIFVCMFLSLFN